ncbi:MAG: helix-turn-helix transcriptional regulator [Thermoanaerobacterales bacterium]|nr:helix-turn-helix transcriptional regulator [Bacillota bacterium]MDI6907852.1 helix-turn-helix transcriptional regulator [Thermoanaerobacterales bacterium]
MQIGSRLRQLRLKAGLSGNALAQRAGVGQSTVSEIESGRTTPSFHVLRKLCRAMDITLGDFFAPDRTAREPLSAELRRLLEMARRLDEKELDTVMLLVGAMVKQKETPSGLPAAAENAVPYDEREEEPHKK